MMMKHLSLIRFLLISVTEMKPLVSQSSYQNLYHNHSSVLAALSTPPPALLQVGATVPGALPSMQHLNSELSLERSMALDHHLLIKQEPQMFEPLPPKAVPVHVTAELDMSNDIDHLSDRTVSISNHDIIQLKAAAAVSHA